MMRIQKSFMVIAVMLSLCGVVNATQPGPPTVTSLFVPLEGDITLTDGDTVHLSGEIHVLTQVRFSDSGVPTVDIFVNLNRVEGASISTGATYLLVGATNLEVVGSNPGPPNIPEQSFNFTLISVGGQPGPPNVPPNPIIPIFLRNFVFAQEAGFEGNLQSVDASFISD
jgi:hypothetical protein